MAAAGARLVPGDAQLAAKVSAEPDRLARAGASLPDPLKALIA